MFKRSIGSLLAIALLGCGGAGGGTAANGGGGGASSGGGGTGGSGAGQGATGGITVDGGEQPKLQCTADLQAVTDENGGVVAQCPPDQGCFEGKCIAACDAAAGSKGNLGCDFVVPNPPFTGQGWAGSGDLAGPCHAAFIANAWPRPAQITLRVGANQYDLAQIGRIPKGNAPSVSYQPIPATGLPPDEVAIVFLSHRPGTKNLTSLECPVTPAVLQDTAVHGSGRGAAFTITTDTPVSAYAILPYGGASSYLPSATLLAPRSAWGKNYFAIGPHDLNDDPTEPGFPWVMIVGGSDGATVQVAPKAALPGGSNVPGAPAGQTTSVTIGAGEIVQWFGANATGAVFDSDQPFGLFTGNTYLHIPSNTSTGGGHDASHQQIPHVGALGSEYVGAGVVTRLATLGPESVPYRLLGVVDGTVLSYDPAPPPGAPATLQAAQVAQFESSTFFTVRSQDAEHPFLFTQYMTGTMLKGGVRADCATTSFGPFAGCGDEEWVNVLPPQQFLQKYVFFSDPTYGTTNLVITRVAGPNGFADVDLACMGVVGGWQPVGGDAKYEVAHVDLMRGGSPIASCNTSQHVAKSDAPFGVTVWGTDWFASYAYPAGGNIGTINQVYVPPVPQ
jgi:hypothetical protein